MRIMFKSKLHRVRLTGADPDYEGSIAIDTDLLKAAGILEYEMVHVWNVTNGERLETYAIGAAAGSGEVSLNGAAARRGTPGDIMIIATFAPMDEVRARRHVPTVVLVDENNRPRALQASAAG
ncbi:MAG TPA: aspartate 1-decarboxylase [Candidatus Binataceae bacterium]|nr:aspartate 1-decarboxylase [Candidatus Binataceae bacterium]